MAPAKKTDGTLDELLKWIEEGNNITDSCALARVSREAFYTWKKEPEILKRITEAEKRCKARVIAQWHRGMVKDWRAAESWMKRKFKDEFSERSELTDKDGKPLIDLSEKGKSILNKLKA